MLQLTSFYYKTLTKKALITVYINHLFLLIAASLCSIVPHHDELPTVLHNDE